MCKTKMAIKASEPRSSPSPSPSSSSAPSRTSSSAATRRKSSSRLQTDKPSSSSSSSFPTALLSNPFSASSSATYRLDSSIATTSADSRTSLSSLRDNLPESTTIYDFSEIRAATNNFLSKRLSASSSSQSWRCVLQGKDVVVFQRKLRKSMSSSDVQQKLSVISRSHYTSIVKLLGVSISGEHIYLVYEFVKGSDLGVCLRNKMNPDFTILSTWMSRMQIATDVAHGLDYIHNTAGLSIDMIHKHMKSSGIIVTEPSFNAKICHFGAAELCGETVEEGKPEAAAAGRQFEGVRGYMSPEFKSTGVATQKTDVYAFGIVILELLTGEEPMKYKLRNGGYSMISVVETAREVVEGGGGEVEGRLRRWVDRRLKDSYPVEAAEKLTRVALHCVQEDPDKRPDMKWVAGNISKLYLASRIWADRVRVPTEISVSLAPR